MASDFCLKELGTNPEVTLDIEADFRRFCGVVFLGRFLCSWVGCGGLFFYLMW